MQKQLALFDTTSVSTPSIKPGDWVKLQRKSTSAAYWKTGEIVRVESVHPGDGSARFWNERAETWGYLHPDDIFLVPPPLDSLSKPIARNTESTVPPADTESILELVEIDSVSVQPIARDTESNCQHSETDTVARVEVNTESNCQHGKFDSVSIVPPADTESTPEPVEIDSVSGPVATYRP